MSDSPKLSGLNAVIFIAHDFDAQCRFYEDVLGLEVMEKWSDGAFFRAGSQVIGIFARGHHPEGEKRLGEARHGLSHLEFTVAAEDRAALESRLKEAGFHAYRDNFQDADGNLFHFVS